MLEKIYAIISAMKTMNDISGTLNIYTKNDTKYTDYIFECDTKKLIDIFGKIYGLMHYSFYNGAEGFFQINIEPDFLYGFSISYEFWSDDINEKVTVTFYNKDNL